MLMLIDSLPVLAAAVATTAAAALFAKILLPLSGEMSERRKKRIAAVKDRVGKKLSGKIPISGKDISDIARGLDASPSTAMEALYQLFAEADNEESHKQIRTLIDDITREEPFEALPEVARPSLARLSTLCHQSAQVTDKELLHPITKLLEEYQEMKRDHSTMKRQNRISYIVALVSFFIGVVGLILAFRGPSKDFVQSEIRSAATNIIENVKAQPAGGAYVSPAAGDPSAHP